MLKFYNYLYFIICSSVKRTRGVDPEFSGVVLISYFEMMTLANLIVIVEIICKYNLITPYKIYFIWGSIILLIVNSFYFYYKKRYSQIINDSKFLVIESKIKAWYVIASMFIIFFLLVILSLIRKNVLYG